ncbi:MAG: WD40 repeat domain-containing protein [Verrucomicrobiales bacterium]
MADPKQTHIAREFASDAPLTCVRFDPKGRFLFGGAENRMITRWDLASDKKVNLKGHESWIGDLAMTPDGEMLISAGYDDTLVWWPVAAEAPSPIRTVKAHQGWIRSVAISRDGKFVASGGNDKAVRLWNVADGSAVREMRAHERDVYSVAFHPSGAFLLSGDLMGQIHQWDMANGNKLRTFDAAPLHMYEGGQAVHYGGVRGLTFSLDTKWLAAGGLHKATNPLGNVQEPLAIRFDWESGKAVKSHLAEGLANHTLWGVTFHPQGFLIGVAGGGGGHLLFWNEGDDKPFHKFDLPDTARGIDLHPDGLRVAVAHHGNKARVCLLAPKEK